MPATVALLSDIHGVLPALDAVLAEPAVREAELIVVTGDHASGPQPTAVLDRLLELGDRVRLIRGNADRELVALRRGEQVEIPDAVTPWAAAELSPTHLAMLAGLPHPLTVPVDGFGEVLFCHGTPRDDAEVVLVDTRMSRWREAFADVPESVSTVVCGHTHLPFLRTVDRRLVVNPGSVGMPYGQPGAHWALLRNGAAELHLRRGCRGRGDHPRLELPRPRAVVRRVPAQPVERRGGAGGIRAARRTLAVQEHPLVAAPVR